MPKGKLGRQICTVEGCTRFRESWGLCSTHHRRFKKQGFTAPSHRSQARAETIAEDGTRLCYSCNERKPWTEEFFRKDPRTEDSLKGTCVTCLRKAVRNSSLKAYYGITLEELNSLVKEQDNKCAVCLVPFSKESKATTPHVDHCHSTGKVRAILCHHCNVLIGHAKESEELLLAAIEYLRKHNVPK